MMYSRNTLLSWIWKLPVCVVAYVAGTMISGIMTMALGIEMPRFPGVIDESLQVLLLFAGGLVFSVGLAAMAIGLAGRWWQRWLVLGTFLFGINGIGNAIEATIFTTLGGQLGMALGFFLPSFLCALSVALLFPSPSDASLVNKISDSRERWKPASLAGRVVLAILAFPVIYFVFGAIVSPIVVPYYNELEFLTIPPMSVLVPILLLRSTLILLVTMPIILDWSGSRRGLILGLALGNAAAVGLGGLVQVTFFPDVLRWTHGIEIFVDSLVYAWVLALLFFPRAEEGSIAGDQVLDGS